MFVSFNMWKSYCMHVRDMLIFPLAWLTMCHGDNLIDWHFQYYLVDCAYEWFCHSKCENYCISGRGVLIFPFSMIRQTMCCRDNLANHAFKGYSILFHSIMIEHLTPLICSILWYSSYVWLFTAIVRRSQLQVLITHTWISIHWLWATTSRWNTHRHQYFCTSQNRVIFEFRCTVLPPPRPKHITTNIKKKPVK